MGNYDSEYQNYYNSLKGRANYSPYHDRMRNSGSFFFQKDNYLVKRIIRDLIGVLVLFAFVIVCKIVQTPQTKSVYSYSKEVVNENYDYSKIETQLKNININDIKNGAENVMNRIRVNEEE
ncbi:MULTISPECIES: hypothetical protein [Clostridium]|uniref:Predicted endopeptidase n=3 Tax=Clostridium TaxID=1485 RepID=D8GNV5_CLOLD|nr:MULTISPECIES: hypothetical protein [Clostridium]ADK13801.1 predicted endopeptidase [Clostridium ljungdahlii DSM 13528]AGY77030.1 endopeptidase [Clostridium autoethanogenum DSM 10061]ALU37172.1 Hypothetical protein CLAU_2745 [Clostridium autoethanogenum DSM 10061]OAA85049.1 hypothetical protein WX45_00807 [Clostridium ljungdahlii DSM 13528]OVY50255.1 hypothetical protein WX72_03016 [Clostridium autoethanogenum]